MGLLRKLSEKRSRMCSPKSTCWKLIPCMPTSTSPHTWALVFDFCCGWCSKEQLTKCQLLDTELSLQNCEGWAYFLHNWSIYKQMTVTQNRLKHYCQLNKFLYVYNSSVASNILININILFGYQLNVILFRKYFSFHSLSYILLWGFPK